MNGASRHCSICSRYYGYVDIDDIALQEDEIMFSSRLSSSRQCFDVSVIADNIIENDEIVSLELGMNNDAVILTMATTMITIINDDCKLLYSLSPMQ